MTVALHVLDFVLITLIVGCSHITYAVYVQAHITSTPVAGQDHLGYK